MEPGGTFLRSYDSVTFTDSSNPATLNAFKLDVYEVTVGRFRNFLAGYPGNLPSSGAGKNPNNLSDAGWNSAWNASMPQSPNELSSKLKCPSQSTWTDTVDIHENFPIDCVTWYEAFAFCIWDGGRLPTEAEWNYVAAGGGDANGQRVYPWSNPSTATTIGEAFAVFCGTTCKPQEVGSRSPQGDARWGHADMSGNVWEWVVDGYSDLYINPCPDCIGARGQTRAVRGGGFGDDAPALHVAWRNDNLPDNRTDDYGIRCARSP